MGTMLGFRKNSTGQWVEVSATDPIPISSSAGDASLAALATADNRAGIGAGATSVVASSGSVANASAVATIPAVSAKTNYITGFTITGLGATAASGKTLTIAGLLGGTISYVFQVLAGATTGIAPIHITFPVPLPASAVNTAIVVTVPAFGAGNTSAIATAYGFVV